MNVLVTGATGFIGKKLCEALVADGHNVCAVGRSKSLKSLNIQNLRKIEINTLDGNTDWSIALSGVDVIFHLAARVHVMNETSHDPLSDYLKINADGTENFAKQAEKHGVKKFIFLSTIGVNGDTTNITPFTEFDNPGPHNFYSISKKIAEEKLIKIASAQKMKIIIVRAPLVYGNGSRGNFLKLIKAVQLGIPLPFKNINNKKSFIYVGNLISALTVCMNHPRAAGIYLVCDDEVISTADLICKIAVKLGKKPRIFYMHFFLIKFLAKMTGNSQSFYRLVNSLTVDSSKIKYELNWNPPFSIDQGLQELAELKK